MSEESDQYADFVIEGVVTIVVGILGLFGNAFIIVTLSRPQMRSSINLLFLSLACFDTIFLVCVLLLLGIPSLSLKMESLREYDRKVVPKISTVLEPVAYVALTASTWTTVCVTIERYIAVCHPFKARYLCSYGKARLAVIVVVVFSVCFNIPEFLRTVQIGTVEYGINDTANGTSEIVLEENEIFSEVYDMWLYLTVMYLVPFLVFVVTNALILRSIRAARRKRRSLVKRLEKDMNLVTMLLCVITVYFLCSLTRIIYLLMERYLSCCVIVEDVSTALVILNSSANFVIYYIVCAKFRETFLIVFCRCRHRKSLRTEEDSAENTQECVKLNTLSAEK